MQFDPITAGSQIKGELDMKQLRCLTNTVHQGRVCVLLLFLGCWSTSHQGLAATIIGFDNVTADDPGILFPGDTFVADGVTFTSGVIPDLVAVNDVITLSSPDDQLVVIENSNNISPPNFAAASSVFGTEDDILMTFSTPITSLQLTTDAASPDGGGADVVRLLALSPTGNPLEFLVLELAEGLDDATSAPANILSVTNGGTPFSHAIFQATTEAEGFDNLTFTAVPEPSTLTILAIGLLATLSFRRVHLLRTA